MKARTLQEKKKLGRTPTVVRLAQCCSSAGYVEGSGADGCQAEG